MLSYQPKTDEGPPRKLTGKREEPRVGGKEEVIMAESKAVGVSVEGKKCSTHCMREKLIM